MNPRPRACHASALPAELRPHWCGAAPGTELSPGVASLSSAASLSATGQIACRLSRVPAIEVPIVKPVREARRDGGTRTPGTQFWRLLFSPLNYVPMKTKSRFRGLVPLRRLPSAGFPGLHGSSLVREHAQHRVPRLVPRFASGNAERVSHVNHGSRNVRQRQRYFCRRDSDQIR